MKLMQIRQIEDEQEQQAQLMKLAEEYPELQDYLSRKSS